MSEIDPGSGETESTDPAMDIVAMVTTQDSRSEGHSALDRVATEFIEDELAVRRMADAPRTDTGEQPFEVRVDEGETLLGFHEACVEQGIDLEIRRLSRQ
jgi:hypothetical protein